MALFFVDRHHVQRDQRGVKPRHVERRVERPRALEARLCFAHAEPGKEPDPFQVFQVRGVRWRLRPDRHLAKFVGGDTSRGEARREPLEELVDRDESAIAVDGEGIE